MVNPAKFNGWLAELIKGAEPGGADGIEPIPSHELIRSRGGELRLKDAEIARPFHSITPLHSVFARLSEEFSGGIRVWTRPEDARLHYIGKFGVADGSEQSGGSADCFFCGDLF